MNMQTCMERAKETQTASSVREHTQRLRAEKGETCQRLDAFVEREFGIPKFTRRVNAWMPPSSELRLCMARQIPTWSIEGLSLHPFADWIRSQEVTCSATPIAFTRDCYGQHGYKRALITLREIHWKKNWLNIQGRKMLEDHSGITERRPILRHLTVKPGDYWGYTVLPGTTLPQFHYGFRSKCLPLHEARVNFDVSDLFEEFLRTSLQVSDVPRRPVDIFMEEDGCDRPVTVTSAFRLNGASVRPTASWYYFLYLAMFVTGERALVASLDDDEDVHAMFAILEEVREACGIAPFIIWIPYDHQYGEGKHEQRILHNEVNPRLLQSNWRSTIALPQTDRPFVAMQEIESQLVHFGRETK